MSKKIPDSCPARFINAYKSLKSDDSIHITKADKADAIVLLDRADYVQKMKQLLNDTDTYETLNGDPTEKTNANFNRVVKRILKNKPDILKKVITISPALPYLYGLVKIHKPGNPMRPIISSVGSCSYHLAKWLVSLLSPLVGTVSTSHVKNSVDLVSSLKSLNCQYDFQLISFDVTSLFTRVPVHALFEFIEEEFSQQPFPISLSDVLSLVKLCVVDSVFTFQGGFHRQTFGMAMGNPLSPVLSNLYMEFFEKNILSSILPDYVQWFRYVDDILCLWPINLNVDVFLGQINNLVPSIKFTVECEVDGSLPFLDLLIHRNDRNLSFSIYRKPTNILSYIHKFSYHLDRTKLSVFSSMFLRALRICTDQFLNTELNFIRDLARKHQYCDKFIQRAEKQALKTFRNVDQSRREFSFKNVLVLPYQQNFLHFPYVFKRYFDINVVFKNVCTVRNLLIKNSVLRSDGCIYKISCNECNKYYIGQTGKQLSKRIKQHQYSIRSGQESNALFCHIRDYDHLINFADVQELAKVRDIKDRNIVESAIISQNFNNTLNLSLGLYSLDNIIATAIIRYHNIEL